MEKRKNQFFPLEMSEIEQLNSLIFGIRRLLVQKRAQLLKDTGIYRVGGEMNYNKNAVKKWNQDAAGGDLMWNIRVLGNKKKTRFIKDCAN